MMSSKNSGFTASDIDRYHSGKMSAQERHALEKAALDDPFLADALEGYALTPTPSADLAAIQSRLDDKLNRKRVIPFYQKYRWLTAAAVLVIIAGTGWLIFSISAKQNESVAVVNKKDQKQKDSSVLTSPGLVNTPKQDSNSAAPDATAEVAHPLGQSPQTAHSTIGKKKHTPVKHEAVDNQIETTVTTSLTSSAVGENNVAANNVITGNEKTRIGARAPSAEPLAKRISGLEVNKGEANKDISAAAPQNNARPQAVILNDANVKSVVHNPSPDSVGLNEVVVSGYAKKAKGVAHVYRPHVVIDTLEPEGGYDKFNDYVAQNFNVPEEFKSKPGPGEVQLSFDVDRNGEPANITVVKSLCQKCDEEAIRVLKQGPKWVKKKDQKGKLTIAFQ